jgi:hypothetical protein
MKRFVLATLLAGAAVVPASQAQAPLPPAVAQPQIPPDPDKPDPARLQAFSATPFYQTLIKHALGGVPPVTFQRCPGLVSTSSQITILRPVRYGDDGFPLEGIWKHSFPVSGCGPDLILNFYFIATHEHRINTVIGFPGSTRADPTLQHQAQTYALTAATDAAALQGRKCSAFAVKNTSFQSYGLENPKTPDPGPSEVRRPWWETWTVAGCGETFLVPLDFIPHAGLTEVQQPAHVTLAGP